MTRNETIAAIATAPGRGGVAIVRVSGSEAFAVASRLVRAPFDPGRIAFRKLYGPDGALIDQAVVLAFKAPRSFTGEDVVEFQCHGGRVTPARVLEAAFAAGARAAGPGEFSERAFLNGKLGLAEAEGIVELVDAKTARAADDALRRLGGARTRDYGALYAEALRLSGDIEHSLDISEDELPDGFLVRIVTEAAGLRERIDRLLAASREGRILRTGASVVLAGAPNAGKSSLLNALLGEARAIVSAQPGTTRDSIEESLDLDGWPVRLTDTAGLRETGDEIEREGVRRSEEKLAEADIILCLGAADSPASLDFARALKSAHPDRAIGVLTKADLSPVRFAEMLAVSSRTGEGIDALRARIVAALESAASPAADAAATPSEREVALLHAARAALAALDDTEAVLLANGLRSAADTLGTLVGAVYSDDLLSSIFSRFCVGK